MLAYRILSRVFHTSNIKALSVCYCLPFKGKNILYHSSFQRKFLDLKKTVFTATSFCNQSASSNSRSLEDLLSTLTIEEKQRLVAILQDEMKAQSSSVLQPPTSKQLFQVGLNHSLPFIGFGFLDNFIMILAGDYIDLTLGTMFGISTMAAAALGNAVSDVAGVGSAQFVESFAAKLGVPSPNLSQRQRSLHSVVWSINIGRAIGVAIGCILGMVPLLFLPTAEKHGKLE